MSVPSSLPVPKFTLRSIFSTGGPLGYKSEDFLLFVTFFTRYLFVAFRGFFCGPYLLGKTVFGPFSRLLRGPHFWQVLRVLALEKSSD